jgi:class 3 adenylate cyclase
MHNDLMRRELEAHKGYEVKTEGDAFMVAFGDPVSAVKWCLEVQQALLKVDWPNKLYQHFKSAPVMSKKGEPLFRGLRVRMGIHCGEASAQEDPVTGRMDYFGQMVNRAARVESVGTGGQVIMSSDVHDRVMAALESQVVVLDLGVVALKGLSTDTHVYQILPRALAERTFAPSAVAAEDEAEKDLKKKLSELQKQNDALKETLRDISAEVEESMRQAKHLLSDVNAASLDGTPNDEVLQELKKQLANLLNSQEATASELVQAKAAKSALLEQSVLIQEQEQLAVQKKKANLNAQIELLKRERSSSPSSTGGGPRLVFWLLVLLLFFRAFVAPLITL